jgi:hypothetical protein
MEIFSNKNDFSDKPEVLALLEKLEKAHADQDELACAMLLTKLKNEYNLIVKPEDKEVH